MRSNFVYILVLFCLLCVAPVKAQKHLRATLVDSAKNGIATAQNELGDCYLHGEGVKPDTIKAFEWYRKAAEQGNAEAQKNLGWCYFNAHGVKADTVKALELYRKAAEQGNAVAQRNLGWCYFNAHGVKADTVKALEWYRKAAEQGNDVAQTLLGLCYWGGHGVKADTVKAVEWFLKSAEQGEVYAQQFLGDSYRHGYGVKQDYSKSFGWYQKAAKQGDALSLYEIGRCYYLGFGAEKDYSKAVASWKSASEKGHELAPSYYAYCLLKGVGVSPNVEEAHQMLIKYAERNGTLIPYKNAPPEVLQFEIARYMVGNNWKKLKDEWQVKADVVFGLVEASAESGYVPAQVRLASIYQNGCSSCHVGVDLENAFHWWQKAADQGDLDAQFHVGKAYMFGLGVPPNDEQAAQWMIKAAWKNNSRAQYRLAELYEMGRGVTCDSVLALYWFQKCANLSSISETEDFYTSEDPYLPEALMKMGKRAYADGDNDTAINYCESAKTYGKTSVRAQDLLDDITWNDFLIKLKNAAMIVAAIFLIGIVATIGRLIFEVIVNVWKKL